MPDLTDRQTWVLDWIREFIAREGIPPTVREIAEGMGSASHTAPLCHLAVLEKKGHIRRRKNTPRGIVILDQPIIGQPQPT